MIYADDIYIYLKPPSPNKKEDMENIPTFGGKVNIYIYIDMVFGIAQTMHVHSGNLRRNSTIWRYHILREIQIDGV